MVHWLFFFSDEIVVLSSPAPHERSISEKLLIAVLILAAGDVVGKALGFIISIIRTRTLTTDEFGGLGFILQTVGMFAQVAGFSLGMAATRYIALYRNSEPRKAQEIAQFILIFGVCTTLIASVLMLVFAPQLSRSALDLTHSMRLSVLVLITQTLAGLALGVLIGMERFRAATYATVMQNVVMLLLTLWWTPMYGLTGAIYAMAIGFVTTLAIAAWGSRDLFMGISLDVGKLLVHKGILWEFCLPSLLSGLIVMPAYWIAMAMMAGQPNGLSEIAIFYAADQLRPLLGLLTNVVSQPMMPIVTSQVRHAQDPSATIEERATAKHKAQNATFRSFQLVICLILPAHSILAFAGPYIMAIFGKAFATEWNVFLVVLAWGAFSGITGLIGISLQAQGRMWLSNGLYVIFGVLLISFCFILQSYGAIGLAFGYMLTAIASFFICGTILYRSGFISLQAMLLIMGSLVWLTFVSLGAAVVPAELRVVAIPFSFSLTMLALFMVMHTQMLHVLRLLSRKLSNMLRKS